MRRWTASAENLDISIWWVTPLQWDCSTLQRLALILAKHIEVYQVNCKRQESLSIHYQYILPLKRQTMHNAKSDKKKKPMGIILRTTSLIHSHTPFTSHRLNHLKICFLVRDENLSTPVPCWLCQSCCMPTPLLCEESR